MKLLAATRYGRPFCLAYEYNGESLLETVVGSYPMSGPESGVGFRFAVGERVFSSKEEMDVFLAAAGLECVDVGRRKGWYSDMDDVVALVARTNPDAVSS